MPKTSGNDHFLKLMLSRPFSDLSLFAIDQKVFKNVDKFVHIVFD